MWAACRTGRQTLYSAWPRTDLLNTEPTRHCKHPEMAVLSNQRGNGRIGFAIALALTAAAIFAAVKVIPVRISAYEFRDALREEARYAAVRDDDATAAKRLMDLAHELHIPLDKKNLNVRRTRAEVVIKASYEHPVDLKVTTYVYKFAAEERAPLF